LNWSKAMTVATVGLSAAFSGGGTIHGSGERVGWDFFRRDWLRI
jgi:hypothetical protein